MVSLEELELTNARALREFITESFAYTPKRRDHILAVADYALEIATLIKTRCPETSCDPDEAERAALLHDIGYLPQIEKYLSECTGFSSTGWHPIDGANYLRSRGEPRLAELIEGHGNSLEVAELMELPSFSVSEDLIAKIVTFCDSQTGPTGEQVSYQKRLEEIAARKGKDSIAFRSHEKAKERTELIIEDLLQLAYG